MTDVEVLRELAKAFKVETAKDSYEQKRKLWRNHNCFKGAVPPIYIRAFAFDEFFEEKDLKCSDPFFRSYERYFHMMRFRAKIGDDFIIEPWLTVQASYDPPTENRWGLRAELGTKPHQTGAAAYKPSLVDERDFEKLTTPKHHINEKETKERLEKLHAAVGHILPIDLNRGPMLRAWTADLATDIAKLFGLEQLMWNMIDQPELLHKVLAFMRDAVLKVHAEVEQAGDFSLTCHENQAMSYCQGFEDPKQNTFEKKRKDLWVFMAAQEYTAVSPEMFDEFMLQYQIPIIEQFGISAYGCCEDLTKKIDLLRKIKNLRRIAVTPFANVRRCAEQIGEEYVLSWRPSPSLMVSRGLDEDMVRKFMREHFQIFKENKNTFDITLKDVETVNHQPKNIIRWVQIVRDELERL